MQTTANRLSSIDMGDNETISGSSAEISSATFPATEKGGKMSFSPLDYTSYYRSNTPEEVTSTSVTYTATNQATLTSSPPLQQEDREESSFNNINTSDAYLSVTSNPRATLLVDPLITQQPTLIQDNVLGSGANFTSNSSSHETSHAGGSFSSIVINSTSGFEALNSTLDTDLISGFGFFSMNGTQEVGFLPNATMNVTTTDTAGNFSEVDSLIANLGDRYKTEAETWILTFVYCVIFITGVVGNICTCIVICKNNYMHTATNYYLFSLAISDVLTLILGLPPELYAVWEAYPWRFGEPYCLFKTFLTEMTSSASILTITAFTVERYVAICHPYRAQRMSTLSRAVKIIILIWIIACLSAIPYPIHTRTFYILHNRNTKEPVLDSLICNIPMEWMPKMRAVFQFTTFLLFIFPMTVITVLYLLIGITLKKAGLARKTSSEGTHHSSQSRKIIQMLVAVVVAFFVCWAPFHAQRLMTSYIIHERQWTPALMHVQNIIWYISGVLYFVSSTTNPILYNLMSRKYREAFKDTICRSCCKQRRDHSALNGFTTNNRTRGFVTADRSTVYSYYSNSSKKYTSMIQKDAHELNHCNRLLSTSSSDSNDSRSRNQKNIIALAEESKGLIQTLDPISECSKSDTKDSLGSALSKNDSFYNQVNNKGSQGKAGCGEDQDIEFGDAMTGLLCKLDNDQSYGTSASGSVSESNQNGTSDKSPFKETESRHSSVANVSLVSGGSLSSLPAVLAGHLKEEMNLDEQSFHLSQYH